MVAINDGMAIMSIALAIISAATVTTTIASAASIAALESRVGASHYKYQNTIYNALEYSSFALVTKSNNSTTISTALGRQPHNDPEARAAALGSRAGASHQ